MNSFGVIVLQNDYKKLAIENLQQDTAGKTLLLNIEYKVNNLAAATLVDATTKEDVARGLILDGFLLVEKRHEKRLAKIVSKITYTLNQYKFAFLCNFQG